MMVQNINPRSFPNLHQNGIVTFRFSSETDIMITCPVWVKVTENTETELKNLNSNIFFNDMSTHDYDEETYRI